MSHGLGGAADTLGFDEADGKAAQAGHVFGAVAGADTTAILVVGPVEDVVAAVFDDPVCAVDLQETLGVSLLWGTAGDAIGEFM